MAALSAAAFMTWSFLPEPAAEPAGAASDPSIGEPVALLRAFEVEEPAGPVPDFEVHEAGTFAEFAVEPQVAAPAEPVSAQWLGAEGNQVANGEAAPDEQYVVAPDLGQLAQPAAADEPEAPLVDEQPPGDVVTPGYDLPTPGFEPEPVGFEAQPMAYEVGLAGALPESVSEPVQAGVQEAEPGADPMSFAPAPHDAEAVPFAVDASVIPPEPELEPAAEAFAWSPWAQEMGLGEPSADTVVEPVQAPAPAPDYADMMAEDQSTGHTEDFPTPQSPTAATAMGGVAVAADPQAAVAGVLPQPRQPGDASAAEPAASPPWARTRSPARPSRTYPRRPPPRSPSPVARHPRASWPTHWPADCSHT